jgi:arylformamidase
MRREIIDISMTVRTGMPVWPGDPALRLERVMDLRRGDPCTLTSLAMSAHTGTHVDAPAHYLRGAATVAEMDAGALVGPARVIEIADAAAVTAAELARHRVRRGDRVLLKTRNSLLPESRRPARDFVALAADAAAWLAGRGVAAVGIDALSVDPPGCDDAHHALLGAGVWVIEGLRLAGVAPGPYELLCLPIRLDAEGAPARALLRRR